MKKLFTGLSSIAIAVFVACDGSGTNANSELLGNSSNSSSESFDEYDGEVEYVKDLPKCTAKKDEKVYYVEDEDIAYTCRYDGDEETGEWVRKKKKKKKSSDDDDKESSSSARKPNVSSSDEADEGKSSASEEPESSSSEGVEGSSSSARKPDVSSSSLESNGDYDGSSSSDETSSSSEEQESSSSEDVESSGSGEGSSASVPGGSSDSSVYDAMANTLTDLRDGQTYNTVTIGTQTWMAENLNYAYTGVPFDNGYYTSDSTSWCYDDDPANCAKYGRLYTWAAAMDSVGKWSTSGKGCGYLKECSATSPVRGVCPKGWHLPSHDEWEALFTAVGGSSTAGSKLKSQTGWTAYSGITNEDAFGFSALPAGGRDGYGYFRYAGDYAFFWSSTEYNSYLAYYMYLNYDSDNGYLHNNYKYHGFSVRCLKD